mmetsp:Transcript_7539/g.28355  ORF Transcript_7539/g.28355 Transcript_7539/m.28355 type:complete len:229 (-) Transcript_7539:8-694(-)
MNWRIGSSCTKTLGVCRTSRLVVRSHAAPSKYKPWMYAPCAGFSVIVFGATCFVTSVYSAPFSRGQPFSLHAVCTSAAVKVSGMCSPESHITVGSPFLTHDSYCVNLFSNHRIQDPSFFSVAAVILAHATGSCPLNRLVASASKSPDMPISPASAFCKLFSVDEIFSTSKFQSASSCNSTICIGDGTPICFLMTGMSNEFGILVSTSLATAPMTSSRETPPPPPPTPR